MSKKQFWALNVVGGMCALLLLINLIFGRVNEHLNQTLVLNQQQVNHAQQLQTTIQNLAGRIARDGRTDPALAALLARQGITFNQPGGQAKPRP